MNMKNILRLMGALALTTGAATSVVACGDTVVGMNAELSKQLGLTDEKGDGTQAVTLDVTTAKDSVTWGIEDQKTPIDASKLLTSENKAANQSCFDFITSTLKVKPTTGTTLADGVFDKAALEVIKGEVTDIKPILAKAEKDYVVTGGTFNFQFVNDKKEKLGDNYSVNLKVNDKQGVIATGLTAIVANFVIADTDVETNAKIKFKVGEKVPAEAKPGVPIAIKGETDAVKQFNALNKLTNLNIAASLGTVTAAGEEWDAGDKLQIVYKAGDVTFAAETTLTLA